jgi:hypothetical protein
LLLLYTTVVLCQDIQCVFFMSDIQEKLYLAI